MMSWKGSGAVGKPHLPGLGKPELPKNLFKIHETAPTSELRKSYPIPLSGLSA